MGGKGPGYKMSQGKIAAGSFLVVRYELMA
jgi:hypothetical protein